jgi:hypothetical protein
MDRALSPKFKVVKLDEKDRPAAIELAKWLLAEGRLKGVPSALSGEIRSIGGAADWGSISSEARSIIATAWGTRVGPNTMMVTHVEDQIPKTKIREITATNLARFR